MLRPPEALKTILDNVVLLPAQSVALSEALGRVLASDVRSADNVPPFACSAMDGFALRCEDVAGASQQTPTPLRVLQDVPAGKTADQSIVQGTAIRIMTGAPVPEGADCVVRVEDTKIEGDTVLVYCAAKQGGHVRNAAEDIAQGEVVLRAGSVLRAAELGVLASVGCGQVAVHPAPRVAVLTTGDELVDATAPLGPGKIRDSNSYTLPAQVRMAGGEPRLLPRIRDTKAAVCEAFNNALEQADMVLTNGGVSVGDYDYVKVALEELGATLLFWRVNQKPGKPLAFWLCKGKPVVSLPGYPVSAMVCFEEYVRPALRKMQGYAWLHRPWRNAALSGGYDKKGDHRLHFVRVRAWKEEGLWKARVAGPQGSGNLSSLTQANALALVREDTPRIEDGGLVELHLTDLQEDH